jgi:hypothetical protein
MLGLWVILLKCTRLVVNSIDFLSPKDMYVLSLRMQIGKQVEI